VVYYSPVCKRYDDFHAMVTLEKIVIRKFLPQDRAAVRRISCETAFLELDRKRVFNDDEILADALTLYYTDYEPESCFVAEAGSRVVGYIIGSKDIPAMNRIGNRILFSRLFLKALRRGTFFNKVNARFLFYCLRSMLRGELSAPDFSKEFPATLHINIEEGFRKQKVGQGLIEACLFNLNNNQARGVHFGVFSGPGKNFFLKMGFAVLFQSERTYLKPYLGKEVAVYVFGRKF